MVCLWFNFCFYLNRDKKGQACIFEVNRSLMIFSRKKPSLFVVLRVPRWWHQVCMIWFSFEYLARFAASPRKMQFVRKFMNFVDLLSIIPYYIELCSTSPETTHNVDTWKHLTQVVHSGESRIIFLPERSSICQYPPKISAINVNKQSRAGLLLAHPVSHILKIQKTYGTFWKPPSQNQPKSVRL